MTYRFLSPALIELGEAAQYYEDRAVGLGADFIAEMEAAIDRILRFPEAWGRISDRYRQCAFRRFPYAVIYTLQGGEEILIVSVFHLSREPLAWQRNL